MNSVRLLSCARKRAEFIVGPILPVYPGVHAWAVSECVGQSWPRVSVFRTRPYPTHRVSDPTRPDSINNLLGLITERYSCN